MEIRNSQEDNLEAILMPAQKSPAVRSVDVAEQLGFSRAGVGRAMRQLVEAGLVQMDGGKHIAPANKGREQAERMCEKRGTYT